MRLEPTGSYVEELQRILSELQYTFERPDEPNQKRVIFTYIVRSDKFSDDGDTWEGEVVRVANPQDPQPFNAAEGAQVTLPYGRFCPSVTLSFAYHMAVILL